MPKNCRSFLFVLSLVMGMQVVTATTLTAQNDCKTVNQGTPKAACEKAGAKCDAGTGPGTGKCVYQTTDLRCDCVASTGGGGGKGNGGGYIALASFGTLVGIWSSARAWRRRGA